MDISNLKPQLLRKAADLKERIDALQAQLAELLGAALTSPAAPAAPRAAAKPKTKRKLSRQAIANIRAGVAKRMAKKAGSAVPPASPAVGKAEAPKKKRTISAAGRRAISLAAKARWARERAAKKAAV